MKMGQRKKTFAGLSNKMESAKKKHCIVESAEWASQKAKAYKLKLKNELMMNLWNQLSALITQ